MEWDQDAGLTREDEIVFVCADSSPWAIALTKALSALTTLRPYCIPSVAPDRIASAIHDLSVDSFGESEATCVVGYNSNRIDVAQDCIDTVVYLRNSNYLWENRRSRWVGRFIGVLPNRAILERLNKIDLFGRCAPSDTCFGDMPAHNCLTAPLCLSVLLTIVQVERLSSTYWDTLQEQYFAPTQLAPLLREYSLSTDIDRKRVVCHEIQAKLKGLKSLAKSHDDISQRLKEALGTSLETEYQMNTLVVATTHLLERFGLG